MTEGSAAKVRESEGRTASCTRVRIQVFLRPAHSIKVFNDFPRSYGEFLIGTRNPRGSACYQQLFIREPSLHKTDQFLRITGW